MTKPTDQQPTTGDIHKRIIAISKEIEPITKDRQNKAQSYAFRGIDDVMNALQPLFAKNGVYLTATVLDDKTEERISKGGSTMTFRTIRMRYSLCAEDGSSVCTEALGEGCDSGDKSAAKAMSIALKYALLQLYLIPTNEPSKDPESDSLELLPRKPAPAAEEREFLDEPAAPGKFHLLEKFAAAKKQLGSDLYYGVLARYKFNHATDVEPDERKGVLEEMRLAYKERKYKREPGEEG